MSTPHSTSGAASRPAANSAPPSDGLSAAARLRGGFRELRAFCGRQSVPLEIVSGGIDLYIDLLLKAWGLRIKSFRGRARFTADGVRISFPCLKGTTLDAFKAARVKHYQRLGYGVVFCGDGTSDLKAARSADAVFAAKRLRRYCLEEGVGNRRLKNFFSVRDFIRGARRAANMRP